MFALRKSIKIQESVNFLLLMSGIMGFGIQKTAQGIEEKQSVFSSVENSFSSEGK